MAYIPGHARLIGLELLVPLAGIALAGLLTVALDEGG